MAKADTHAKKLEVMRDQFRARNAVYKCEKGSIPAIGKGTDVYNQPNSEYSLFYPSHCLFTVCVLVKTVNKQ